MANVRTSSSIQALTRCDALMGRQSVSGLGPAMPTSNDGHGVDADSAAKGRRVMWLSGQSEDAVHGAAREVFDQLRRRHGHIPELFRILALSPGILLGRETLRVAISSGTSSLGKRREELLNYFVSTLGSCFT